MTARHRRRAFGTISRLPSGRFRARYTGPDGARYSAPATFDTRAQAGMASDRPRRGDTGPDAHS